MKLGFLGGGKIADCILQGLSPKRILQSNIKKIHVVEKLPERKKYLQDLHKNITVSDNIKDLNEYENILLCVKPNILLKNKNLLKTIDWKNKLAITVIAGIPIKFYKNELGTKEIIRAMPNTSCAINKSMTIWKPCEDTSLKNIEKIQLLFETLGENLQVEDESLINIGTAISGSGPAFCYLFIESMIDTTVQLGFSRNDAKNIVNNMMYGAIKYALIDNRHPVYLRNDITSPAGTTAAGLYQLEKKSFRTVVSDGIIAAYNKTINIEKNI